MTQTYIRSSSPVASGTCFAEAVVQYMFELALALIILTAEETFIAWIATNVGAPF